MASPRLLVSEGREPLTAAQLAERAGLKNTGSIYAKVGRAPIDGRIWHWADRDAPAPVSDRLAPDAVRWPIVCSCESCGGRQWRHDEIWAAFPRVAGRSIRRGTIAEIGRLCGHPFAYLAPAVSGRWVKRADGNGETFQPDAELTAEELWSTRTLATDPWVIDNVYPINPKGPGVLTKPWGVPPCA